MLSVSDMPAYLGDSTAETTIRPFATEKFLSDKQITWQVADRTRIGNPRSSLRLARARLSALANAGQVPELFKHGVDQKHPAIPCATPNSHRPVQKVVALIGNPKAS